MWADAWACVRSYLIRLLYPLPSSIEVCLGEGVHRAMLYSLVKHVRVFGIDIVTLRERNFPAVWINGEEEGTCGWSAVARYLGRISRLYPSTPENAIYVDGCFDMLEDFLRHIDAGDTDDAKDTLTTQFVNQLEDDYFADSMFIVLDQMTVIDSCVYGALTHLKTHCPPLTEYPTVEKWWSVMADEDDTDILKQD